ncbi:hypothetical protein [Marinomonas sp. FW-1]|uniref:hypothetical protein n=1 Tax=Marinomonas sp. FW-1 TaxID=2071621 RepID=UPI0010C04AE3|nr:hypothetical protein [Marinomonas sp. FW-1]
MANEWDHFRELIEAQRKENREQFGELRKATSEMAQSVSRLTALVARVEERHLSHDDGMKRIGKVVDDHESRIRTIESRTNTAFGSWKAITIIASMVTAVVTIAINIWGNK